MTINQILNKPNAAMTSHRNLTDLKQHIDHPILLACMHAPQAHACMQAGADEMTYIKRNNNAAMTINQIT